MDILQIENKYAELKYAFDTGSLTAEAFQSAVDALQAQDDYGRYWVIGAESGQWYYFDGVQWTEADPYDADSLPFVDENGVYWMLGKDTNEWYFFDGENWQRPEGEESTTPEMDSTEYYQDEQGRYWAKGAKSGQWYFYDENGWHLGEELSPPIDSAPSSPPPMSGFEPIHPAPSYLQNQPTPSPALEPDYAPVEPEIPAAESPQPAPPPPTPDLTAPTVATPPQAVEPPPVSQPQTPAQNMPPATESDGWYYFDGTEWTRYEEAPQTEEAMPEEESIEAGTWYYFDGDKWMRYQDSPENAATFASDTGFEDEGAADEIWDEDADLQTEDFADDDELIEIDDIEEYVEVIEIDEDDIIEDVEEMVDAEFEVEVLTPEEEKVVVTTPVVPIAEEETTQESTPKAKSKAPVTAETPAKESAAPKAATKVMPKAQVEASPKYKGVPLWAWTSISSIGALILSAFIIIGILFLLNNRDRAVAMIEAQQTPTLAAAQPATTPTLAPTPTATITPSPAPTQVPLAHYSNNYFGIALDYPAGWDYKEDDDLLIFAPSARALNRDAFNGASLRISLGAEQNITTLLADELEKFSPISETLDEGILNIGQQTWTSAQVSFNAESMGGDAVALIASTVIDNAGYTLVALAPANQWEAYKPLFQSILDSFSFNNQGIAEVPTKATATQTATSTAPAPKLVTYTVESGDTLGGIAAQFDVSIDDLVKANELSGTNAILQIGQELIIPQDSVAIAAVIATPTATPKPKATATPKATQTPTPKITATKTATPKASGTPQVVTYIVKAGDTLGGIAAKFDVSIADLVDANNLSSENAILQIGQELIIPQDGVTITATATAKVTGTAATPTPKATATATPAPAPVLSGRILYPAYSPDIKSFDLWSTNVDGSNSTIIARNASAPKFNADGTLLAYRSWDPSNRGIYFIDYAGGRQDRLTGFVEDNLPAWYTDGTLVMTSRRDGNRVPRLFRFTQAGDDADHAGEYSSDYVDTMPDNRLVMRGCTPSGDCGLWMMPPGGETGNKISTFTGDTAPDASPDGARIALMSAERDSAGNWEIWTIAADGSDPIRLTENGANDGLPTWSPDGKSIAFVSDRGGAWAVWVMNADGSNQRKLFGMPGAPDGQVEHDTQNSHGWLEERITWAP